MTPLLTLALLATSAPALASDIDEVAPYDASATSETFKADGEQLQERSRGNGSKSNKAKSHGAANKAHNAADKARDYNRNHQGPDPRPMGPNVHNRPNVVHHGNTTVGHRGNTTVVKKGDKTVVHRPGATVVNRPNGPTVTHRPGGPNVVHRPGPNVAHRPPVVHRPGVVTRPGVVHRPVVVKPAVRTVRYTHVRPYHGIFVYGPRPVSHVHYHSGRGPVEVARDDLPARAIDRANSIGIGVEAGSMISSTPTGDVYGDPGFGLNARYRPAESVGLELGVGHHGSAFVDPIQDRSQTQVDGSVQLFAFPWTRVSPYALAGVTWNSANFTDTVQTGNGFDIATQTDAQFGLHGGLGLELALGKNFALDLEGRYVGWIDERVATEAPGAIQANAGLEFYFK